jgi:S1-C subfamily serine protease
MAVEPNGPADQAGLLEEDLIVALGEEPATSVDDLHKALTRLPVGIPVTVTLLRRDRRLERMVVPEEYPDPMPRV